MPNLSKFVQKDGHRAQLSSVGHKLLYEIYPCFRTEEHKCFIPQKIKEAVGESGKNWSQYLLKNIDC